MQGISVCWFYILQLYYIDWLALVIFWWSLKGFLCRGSCHLQTVRVLLLFQSRFILFLFLLWLLWLGLLKPCWIVAVRVGTLVLFLILKEMLSIFLPLWIRFAVGLLYMAFLMLRYVPSMPAFWRVFIVNGCWVFTGPCCCVLSLVWWIGAVLRCGAWASHCGGFFVEHWL